MQSTAKKLRFDTKELLETISRGEEVIITYRGKPYAKLIPFSKSKSKKRVSKLFGIWKDRKDISDVRDYIKKLRKTRVQ